MGGLNFERWQSLMLNLNCPDNRSTFDELQRAHAEKHRHYHTHNHINAMLQHFDKISAQLNRPSLVELAIWFHDAIYNVYKKNNEKKSAEWAQRFLTQNQATEEDAGYVYDLIMATCHNAVPTIADTRYLVDMDLTILGTSETVFQHYEVCIRKEYRWVPMPIYQRNRKKVLESFLKRPTIYLTDYFKETFEVKARENLETSLAKL